MAGTLFSSQRERPSRLSATSTKPRRRHLTHRPCASECKTSERACRRQSTGAPNTWQNCCGATSKDGLTESRPPESPDSETRPPCGGPNQPLPFHLPKRLYCCCEITPVQIYF